MKRAVLLRHPQIRGSAPEFRGRNLIQVVRNDPQCPQVLSTTNGITFGSCFIQSSSIRKLRQSRAMKRQSWLQRLFHRKNANVKNGKYKPFTTRFDRMIDYTTESPSQRAISQLASDMSSQPDVFSAIQSNMDVALKRIANDCAISVVVDCSGSMAENSKCESSVLLAVTLGKVLDSYHIAYEVLGFNVIKGRSQQLFNETAQASDAGRLGDVHHRIFKSFDHHINDYDCIAGIYDAVLRPDDEIWGNIDGEALLWAHERMKKRQETFRFILMLTDGNPAGEDANDSSYSGWQGGQIPRYFASHLVSVRKQISKGTIMVIGVGIGDEVDVAKYYDNRVQVSNPGALMDSVLSLLQVIALQT